MDDIQSSLLHEAPMIVKDPRQSPALKPSVQPAIKQDDDLMISWKEKQRSKCISTLRRQIEWFVKSEGLLTVETVMGRSRIKDLTDNIDDVVEAVKRSDKLKLDNNIIVSNRE